MALTDKLAAIANAIRTKTGDTATLTLEQMVTAIEGIETGGGGDTSNEDGLIDGSVLDYANNRVTEIYTIFKGYTDLKSVSFASATYISTNAFNGCTGLTTIDIPAVKEVGAQAFYGCTALTALDAPKLTKIGIQAFRNCTSLAKVTLPGANMSNYAFTGCSNLATVDFKYVVDLPASCFSGCKKLATLVFRAGSWVATLKSGALSSTAIASGTGYIYVPDDMVDSYKSASNWSTYADQIKPLSEYTEA